MAKRPITVRLLNFRADRTLFVNDLTIVPLGSDGVVTHFVGIMRERDLSTLTPAPAPKAPPAALPAPEALITNGGYAFRIPTQMKEALQAADDVPYPQLISERAPPYKIIHVNSAWCRLCGYRPAELLGKPFTVLHADDGGGDLHEQLRHAFLSGQQFSGQAVYRTKARKAWASQLVVSPLLDAGGAASHFFVHLLRPAAEPGASGAAGGDGVAGTSAWSPRCVPVHAAAAALSAAADATAAAGLWGDRVGEIPTREALPPAFALHGGSPSQKQPRLSAADAATLASAAAAAAAAAGGVDTGSGGGSGSGGEGSSNTSTEGAEQRAAAAAALNEAQGAPNAAPTAQLLAAQSVAESLPLYARAATAAGAAAAAAAAAVAAADGGAAPTLIPTPAETVAAGKQLASAAHALLHAAAASASSSSASIASAEAAIAAASAGVGVGAPSVEPPRGPVAGQRRGGGGGGGGDGGGVRRSRSRAP